MINEHKSKALRLAMLAREPGSSPIDAAGLLFSAGLIALLGVSTDKSTIGDLVKQLVSPAFADVGLELLKSQPTHVAIVTDEQLSDENGQVAKSLIEAARFITPDPTTAATGLLTAATVIIEREVGRGMATAALSALLAPTVSSWAARDRAELVQ